MHDKTQFDAGRRVHLKKLHGCPASRGESFDHATAKQEMLRPSLPAWIEEPDDLAGRLINRRKVASATKVAVATCEGEVGEMIFAAMFFRQDMVDMKAREG